MIQNAQRSVDILTGSFPEFFAAGIVDDIRCALTKPEMKMRIILVNEGVLPAPLLKLAKETPKKLEVFAVRKEFRNAVQGKVPHFCVADDKAYRKEEIHSPTQDFEKDPSVHATANYNSPSVSRELNEAFGMLLPLADQLILDQ
jgi:hypothetical protein